MNQGTTHRNTRDLGIATNGKKVFLYSNLLGKEDNSFRLGVSLDGLSFRQSTKHPHITTHDGKSVVNTRHCSDFRIASSGKHSILLYKNHVGHATHFYTAFSKDLISWTKKELLQELSETAMIVPNYQYNDSYVLYTGDSNIKIAFSKTLKEWDIRSESVLAPRENFFDKYPLELGSLIMTEKGILVVYFVREHKREGNHYMVGAALFDLNDPTKLLWRTDAPIWEQPDEWDSKQIYPMGALNFKGKFILYLGAEGEGVHAVCFRNFNDIFNTHAITPMPMLKKAEQNPIIAPVLKHHWEAQSTFNPAAVYDKDKVHIIYRAQGYHNTSVLGYATSKDGVTIDERLTEPIYSPTQPFETPNGQPFVPNHAFVSGGGWGGCEDPRITKIEDTFYLTYVAFNGIEPPRVALSSISNNDFHERRWDKWETPKLISPPGVVDKNACLFPEKVNGKYVMMHRIFPNILIDFLDDLEFKDGTYLKGEYKITPRENSWDSRKAGAGAPPIKTKDGWLLIYHAVDDRDDSQYKIGAMLLDLNNPVKVLYRSTHPILRPTEWYENHGFKAGVAYPCGAVVIDNTLFVYYGGADSVVCTATKNLDEFLTELKASSPVKPTPVPLHKQVLAHYGHANPIN